VGRARGGQGGRGVVGHHVVPRGGVRADRGSGVTAVAVADDNQAGQGAPGPPTPGAAGRRARRPPPSGARRGTPSPPRSPWAGTGQPGRPVRSPSGPAAWTAGRPG